MLQMLLTLCLMTVALVSIYAGIEWIGGNPQSSKSLVNGCITVVFLYLLIVSMYTTNYNAGAFHEGIPFLNEIERYGSLTAVFRENKLLFSFQMAELVVLVFAIKLISKIMTLNVGKGVSGLLISRLILVMTGILLNGFLMQAVKDHEVYKWGVHCLYCIISGGSVIITPFMIVGRIMGLDSDNKLVAYIVNELPKTELGKAMSTSVSSSVIFLFYVAALEKQYGTVKQMLRGGIVLLNTAAPLIIMVLGIGMLIKIILK